MVYYNLYENFACAMGIAIFVTLISYSQAQHFRNFREKLGWIYQKDFTSKLTDTQFSH